MLKGQKVYALMIMTTIEGMSEVMEHDCSDSLCGIFASFDLALSELQGISEDFNKFLDAETELEDRWVMPDMVELGVKYEEGLQTYWIDEYVIDQTVRSMEAAIEVKDAGNS